MTLEEAANKLELVGHVGPHPAYNAEVYERLTEATDGLEGEAYTQAFKNALQKIRTETGTVGTELNKLATGGGR